MADALAEAVAQAAEARQLAADHPGDIGLQRRLLAALHNLGARYSQAGRRSESAGLGDEALIVVGRLEATQPTDADWADVAWNLTYIAAYLPPSDEATRTTAAAVDIYRRVDRPGDLRWALDNLAARYAAAPWLVILRAAVSSSDPQSLRDAIGEHRLSFVAARVDEQGVARADVYANRDVLDALIARGLAVEVLGSATADGIARQGEVGHGNRFAGGLVPPTLGIEE